MIIFLRGFYLFLLRRQKGNIKDFFNYNKYTFVCVWEVFYGQAVRESSG